MPKIIVDGKEYEVKDKKNLLEACLSLGLDLPYFCWHPAMNSVGACRQCAVTIYKDKDDTKGKLTMACMEPVRDGMIVSLEDKQSKEFRAHVIEWLMTNHPHDCPICDEGGECHLQDMTVMTGHAYRNHRYKKRTYNNQYLGPFINHEMNRCIQCYRCVRFYRDYADGRDFNAFASKNHVYFGRSEEGTLENEFSGNLVEVCPTGVFTDKTLKQHYTRKWDLTHGPSICHNCGIGCNIIAAERYGSLRRILSRYNSKVNGYFICDRGRFGYEWVNSNKRISMPVIRNNENGKQEFGEKDIIIEKVSNLVKNNKVIGIGSAQSSLEANFALRKLVGKENFYNGFVEKENELLQTSLNILNNGKVRTPSLKEVEEFDAVFVLGEDVTNTAPMLALSIRQAIKLKPKSIAEELNIPMWHDAAVREAVQDERGPLYVASVNKTKLSDVAKDTLTLSPQSISRLGFAVANIINKDSPEVIDLSEEEKKLANLIAEDLQNADKPLIVTGPGCKSEDVLKAAYNIALALYNKNDKTGITITSPEVNSTGLVMMENKSFDEALNRIKSGEVKTLLILENYLYRNNPKEKIDELLNNIENVVALSTLENDTTLKSNYVIPVGSFAESDGTVVNNEGRAQRFYQCKLPDENILESWRYIAEIGKAAGKDEFSSLNVLDDFVNAIIKELPQFEGIQDTTPPSDYRKVSQKIPREPHRYSGRTAMNANKNVSEPKPPEDIDSLLSYTMEGYRGKPPSSIVPFYWSPGWNSVQSINKYQIEVGGPLHDGDPGVRLIEPKEDSQLSFFTDVPGKFEPQQDQFLVVPLYHIYGSEEKSNAAKAIRERIPEPYLALNKREFDKLNLDENDKIKMDGIQNEVTVRVLNELPDGTLGYPVGLPGMQFMGIGSYKKIKKA